jgi:hypothetical protein
MAASRSGDHLFLHVVNTSRTRSIAVGLTVSGMTIGSGSVFEIAGDPEFEVWSAVAEVLAPQRKQLPPGGQWTFPPASVSAVDLDCRPRSPA